MPTVEETKAKLLARTQQETKVETKLLPQMQQEEETKAEPVDPTKIYYSRTQNSRFIFSDGVELWFYGGRAIVGPRNYPGIYQAPTVPGSPPNVNNGRPCWQVYQEELDAICPPKGNNPNIYKEASALPILPVPKQNAVTENELAVATTAINTSGPVLVRQEMGAAGSGLPSDPNASTLDSELIGALAFSSDGGGAAVTPLDPAKLPLGAVSSIS